MLFCVFIRFVRKLELCSYRQLGNYTDSTLGATNRISIHINYCRSIMQPPRYHNVRVVRDKVFMNEIIYELRIEREEGA